MIFNKIGLAVTFSPNGKALLLEAGRLSRLCNSELLLIHIGKKDANLENSLKSLIAESGLRENEFRIIWETGDPAKVILKVCENEKIYLLIAGALEKERTLKYYAGSIARKIMREAGCSVLIKIAPKNPPLPHNRICVSAVYSPEGENAVKKAYELAKLQNAEELVILKEFIVPGLAITVSDYGSVTEAEKNLADWQVEEKEKLILFAKELNLTGINIKTECLYGKEGYEAGKYVKNFGGDLLVINSPRNRLKLFDRIFQHDLEFLFESIPCDLLLLKPEKGNE